MVAARTDLEDILKSLRVLNRGTYVYLPVEEVENLAEVLAVIVCNVIAGYYHDHLLVPEDKAEQAEALIAALPTKNRYLVIVALIRFLGSRRGLVFKRPKVVGRCVR